MARNTTRRTAANAGIHGGRQPRRAARGRGRGAHGSSSQVAQILEAAGDDTAENQSLGASEDDEARMDAMLLDGDEDDEDDGDQQEDGDGMLMLLLFFFVVALISTDPSILYFSTGANSSDRLLQLRGRWRPSDITSYLRTPE